VETPRVRAIKPSSSSYAEIIEVNLPTRFYWTEEGFDGFDFYVEQKLMPWEIGMLKMCINALAGAPSSPLNDYGWQASTDSMLANGASAGQIPERGFMKHRITVSIEIPAPELPTEDLRSKEEIAKDYYGICYKDAVNLVVENIMKLLLAV